ncbi:acyltransferase family protein [Muricoccus radiodurans]|uniref:acyltransferase family protein n=1 Tax=Muricoccus radiodurans TaxID=2231721 RepID=UPI003CF9EAC5
MSSGDQPRFIPALTGLRGLGAIWVFLYHLVDDPSFPGVKLGFLGVDLFFVLSGFVLIHVYRWQLEGGGWEAYRNFLQARLARIYPLHLASLLLVLCVVLVVPGFADRYHTSGRWSYENFAAQLLLIQNWGYFFPTSWNTPAWSLSAEWAGYLVFPVFLLGVRWVRSPTVAICLASACVLGVPAILNVWGAPHSATGSPGMARMLCGMAAGVLAYVFFVGKRILPVLPCSAVIAGLLVLANLPGMVWAGNLLILPLLLLAAQMDNPVARTLSSRPMMFLGEISFSIYLLHWIVLQLNNWVGDVWPWLDQWVLLRMICVTVVVLILSWASYLWVELPARRMGRRISLPLSHVAA